MQVVIILLFTALPLLELAVMIRVAEEIGLWPTIFALIASVMIGGAVIQVQGLSALRRTIDHLSRGEPPVEPMLDGALLCLAGGLFIFPGFLTDIAGAILLIPPIRHAIAHYALTHSTGGRGGQGPGQMSKGPGGRPGPAGSDKKFDKGVVIEGEYERVDPPRDGQRPPKSP